MPCGGCGDNCKCTSSKCCQSCKCDSACNCSAKKTICGSGDACSAPKK